MNNENNSLIALDKILKIKNTTIDQLTSEQNNKLAKYLDIFSKYKHNLFRAKGSSSEPLGSAYQSITATTSTSRWLCYFTYIHHSRYHESRNSYLVVCIDKDFTKIIEDSIDYPRPNSNIKINEILSEEDQKFHEERLKKPRQAGWA